MQVNNANLKRMILLTQSTFGLWQVRLLSHDVGGDLSRAQWFPTCGSRCKAKLGREAFLNERVRGKKVVLNVMLGASVNDQRWVGHKVGCVIPCERRGVGVAWVTKWVTKSEKVENHCHS